ncbi:NTP transferase domain-containing protein [Marinicella sediminis]|uniref:NTP transferase domain-containing protein n=1 Tax=Marinicella sediminis TaxID=1792834 RepID=A0ABV7JA67_9GAMM|nr:nucleotidyltransferase family protein [Marinicella sediminis]
MRIKGLVLAAGRSSRLGQPKQLLKTGSMTLLEHIEHRLLPLCDELWVVLGYQHEIMQQHIQQASVIVNPHWRKGMGHSLKTGFRQISADADAVLVALCDQPYITQSHYQSLIKTAHQHRQHLISSTYDGKPGVPAVFTPPHFSAVLSIGDEQGARSLLRQTNEQHISINCPQGNHDIDTADQLSGLS